MGGSRPSIFIRLCVIDGFNVHFLYKLIDIFFPLAHWDCDFPLRAWSARRQALTHACVLIALSGVCIGQFENGVFNHHKLRRPLRKNIRV